MLISAGNELNEVIQGKQIGTEIYSTVKSFSLVTLRLQKWSRRGKSGTDIC